MGKSEVDVSVEAFNELEGAQRRYPAFNSAHEGLAVILEEVDKLRAQVWLRQDRRDIAKMREQAICIAAMGMRFAVEVCDGERGRK